MRPSLDDECLTHKGLWEVHANEWSPFPRCAMREQHNQCFQFTAPAKETYICERKTEKGPKNASRRDGLQIRWRMWWDFFRMCQDELWDRGWVFKTLVKFYGQGTFLNSAAALLGETSTRVWRSVSIYEQVPAARNSNYSERPCSSRITGIDSLCRRWAELWPVAN